MKIDKIENYGLVIFDKNMKVYKFIEKSNNYENTINYINAGVYVIKKELIQKIDPSKPTSLEKDFFPKIIDMNIQAFILGSNQFIDIGTPNSLKKANNFFNK